VRRLFGLCLCVAGACCEALAGTAVARGEDIEVTLACVDESAGRNLLPEDCRDLSSLRGWNLTESNAVKVVKGAGPHGEDALFVGKPGSGVWRHVSTKLVRKGRPYIMTCWVKTGAVPPRMDPPGGIGCSLGTWTADWKNGCAVEAHGISPERWQLVVSEPTVMKLDAAFAQLSLSARYYSGGGWICAPALYAQGVELSVAVKAQQPIRQVRLLSESGEVVYDSGVLKGDATHWEKALSVSPGQGYCACAVTADGDVACASLDAKRMSH